MNDIQIKREAIKKVYPNKAWSDQVNRMKDDQVIALYLRFQRQHKLK